MPKNIVRDRYTEMIPEEHRAASQNGAVSTDGGDTMITWKSVEGRNLPQGTVVPQTYQSSNRPFGLGDTNKPTIQQMADRNVSLFARALTMRANEFASAIPEVKVLRMTGGEPTRVDGVHPWGRLLRRPNPSIPAFRFWKWMHLVRDLSGDANAWIETNDVGVPIALWPIYPEWGDIRPQLDKKGDVTSYIYMKSDAGGGVEIPPDRLLRLELPSPIRAGETVSLLEKGVYELDAELHSQEYETEFLSEGRPPNVYIKMDEQGTFVGAGQDREDEERFREGYMGERSNHVPIIRGGSIEGVSINPEDLQMLESRAMRERRIFTITGVPRSLFTEEANRSNVEGAQRTFSKFTVQPDVNGAVGSIGHQFEEAFGAEEGALKLRPPDVVPKDEQEQANLRATKIRSGQLKPNEARAQDDREPAEGGDQLYVSKDLIPISRVTATNETENIGDFL